MHKQLYELPINQAILQKGHGEEPVETLQGIRSGQNFTALLHSEEQLYVAECLEIGTVSQGATIEEAITNLREATELYLEETIQ